MPSEDTAALHAESAVRRLTAFYCDAVNHHDPARAVSVYARDGQLVMPDGTQIIGREAIGEGVQRTLAAFSFIHQICHSGLIDIHGDHASARWSFLELARRIADPAMGMIIGTYEDDLVRTEEGWRFSRRRLHIGQRALIDLAKLKSFPALEQFVSPIGI